MNDTTLRIKVRSAKRLDQAMTFRGRSNRGLALETGIHRSTIGHLRSGHRNRAAYDDAIRIAEALGMPTDYLFAPETTPTPTSAATRSNP